MKPGEDQNVPATVEFPDGSTKEITIPVHKDELVHPQTRDLDTGKDGSLPDASKSVTNLPDLPKGTEVKWGEGAEETAKNLKPGESAKVPVVITIPGEGTKTVEITITRPKSETVEPKTRDLDTGKDGSLPDASKAVTNLPDLPKGTEVKWGEGAEETAKNLKPGESAKVPVVITIPGEGTKVVEITITRPDQDDSQDNHNATNLNDNNGKNAHDISKVSAKKLPQTGENSDSLSALGAALVGIAGLGLFLKKKKED